MRASTTAVKAPPGDPQAQMRDALGLALAGSPAAPEAHTPLRGESFLLHGRRWLCVGPEGEAAPDLAALAATMDALERERLPAGGAR